MLGVSTRLLCRSEFYVSCHLLLWLCILFLSCRFISVKIFCHVISYMLFSAKCWPFLIMSICFRSFSSTLNSCLCLLIFHDVFQWHVRCVRGCSDVDLFLLLFFQLLSFLVFLLCLYCASLFDVFMICSVCFTCCLCCPALRRIWPLQKCHGIMEWVRYCLTWAPGSVTRASKRFRPWALNVKPHNKA